MSETRIVIDTGVAVSAVLLPSSVPRQAFDAACVFGKVRRVSGHVAMSGLRDCQL